MISYWEKSSLINYDLIVIGGGITGMFCALSYRKIYPKAKIAILDCLKAQARGFTTFT